MTQFIKKYLQLFPHKLYHRQKGRIKIDTIGY